MAQLKMSLQMQEFDESDPENLLVNREGGVLNPSYIEHNAHAIYYYLFLKIYIATSCKYHAGAYSSN